MLIYLMTLYQGFSKSYHYIKNQKPLNLGLIFDIIAHTAIFKDLWQTFKSLDISTIIGMAIFEVKSMGIAYTTSALSTISNLMEEVDNGVCYNINLLHKINYPFKYYNFLRIIQPLFFDCIVDENYNKSYYSSFRIHYDRAAGVGINIAELVLLNKNYPFPAKLAIVITKDLAYKFGLIELIKDSFHFLCQSVNGSSPTITQHNEPNKVSTFNKLTNCFIITPFVGYCAYNAAEKFLQTK